MQRAFDRFEQIGDAVETQPRTQCAQVSRLDAELPRCGSGPTRREAVAKSLIHDVSKRSACPSRFRPQLGSDIVVECEGRAHNLNVGVSAS